ncbi:extracellular solute-binding protein [Herbaspirillum seropedicae]|nr:extracellular solute-binding protein [Herbaspirillum seropedicae]
MLSSFFRFFYFEELTGIKVKYPYVPFTTIRDKLTAEMVAENGDYDVVSIMDVWAPSLKSLLHPLPAWTWIMRTRNEHRPRSAFLPSAPFQKTAPPRLQP